MLIHIGGDNLVVLTDQPGVWACYRNIGSLGQKRVCTLDPQVVQAAFPVTTSWMQEICIALNRQMEEEIEVVLALKIPMKWKKAQNKLQSNIGFASCDPELVYEYLDSGHPDLDRSELAEVVQIIKDYGFKSFFLEYTAIEASQVDSEDAAGKERSEYSTVYLALVRTARSEPKLLKSKLKTLVEGNPIPTKS